MKDLRPGARKITSRDEAFSILSPFYDDAFLASIQNGLNLFATLSGNQRAPLRTRTKANLLNDYIVDDLEKNLEGEKGVRVDDDYGFKIFIFDGTLALRVKKLDHCKRPHNIHTRRQDDLENQQLELPGAVTATFVTLGYQLDKLWDKATTVQVICRENGYLRWILPVATDPLQAVMFEPGRQSSQKKARVKVKGKQEGKA